MQKAFKTLHSVHQESKFSNDFTIFKAKSISFKFQKYQIHESKFAIHDTNKSDCNTNLFRQNNTSLL